MKTQSILFTMVAALVTVGCGHHSHHRDHESLTGKVIKYPFRMTGYAIGAPFHPFESTRKAFNATIDIPEKWCRRPLTHCLAMTMITTVIATEMTETEMSGTARTMNGSPSVSGINRARKP